MPKKYIFLLIFNFYFISCAPLPVHRAHSLEDNKYFLMGRETIIKVDKRVKLILNFEQQSGNELVFYLVVENNSLKPIKIDPSTIYAELEPGINNLTYIYAVDPESRLVQIDNEINQSEANKNTTDVIDFITVTLDLASSVAGLFQERTDEQINEENNARIERQETMERSEIEYQNNMNGLNEKKMYWQNDVLRKTTLNTGEKIGGFFYLPVENSLNIFNLVVPIDFLKFRFKYKLSDS